MLYHKFDNGNGCTIFYSSGKLTSEMGEDYNQTLDFDPDNQDAECISLYVDNFKNSLPEGILLEAKRIKNKKDALLKSFRATNIPLDEYCFYENIPDSFLHHMGEMKDEISKYILNNFQRPDNYDHLLNIKKLVSYISENRINIVFPLNVIEKDFLDFKVRTASKRHIFYDHKGTKTNRFTCFSNSFPILNMPKKFRSVVKPNNDSLVEFDMNASEIRVALSMLGKNVDGIEDIYKWVNEEFFEGKFEREVVKKKLISWLYGKKDGDDDKLDLYIDKNFFLDKFYNDEDGFVFTPFGRTIFCDKIHAVNYLLQSTSADIVHVASYKIMNFLKSKNANTRIYFTVHDSIILDVDKTEHDLLFDCLDIFSDTILGKFEVNIRKGKDYGDLK